MVRIPLKQPGFQWKVSDPGFFSLHKLVLWDNSSPPMEGHFPHGGRASTSTSNCSNSGTSSGTLGPWPEAKEEWWWKKCCTSWYGEIYLLEVGSLSPLFTGFYYPCLVVWVFFHQQYLKIKIQNPGTYTQQTKNKWLMFLVAEEKNIGLEASQLSI